MNGWERLAVSLKTLGEVAEASLKVVQVAGRIADVLHSSDNNEKTATDGQETAQTEAPEETTVKTPAKRRKAAPKAAPQE